MWGYRKAGTLFRGLNVKKFLKLTGGSFTGRRIHVPGTGVRPATNLVREAVFSTLISFFEEGVTGLTILDLFAGTGSLGLEALGRGAESVTFVDSDRESIRSIRKNLAILGFTGDVVGSDVISFLKRKKTMSFDLIFMDPPYRYKKSDEVVEFLKDALDRRLSSILVYERAFKKELPAFGEDTFIIKRKKYGQSELLYYRI